ncbi:hypothetical protein L596_023446 [Steinernema carpocapsae]|uniref:Uncharacterized protein n=1 Tax=Steinernema carpocapsae TaxID=34508 RepID=A0A4U5MDP1_STECR|nr:hypothetical protein L596_023446 [Steinernema carpocapsae]
MTAIYAPKITVHFGPVRVIVSSSPSMRVGDLATIATYATVKRCQSRDDDVHLVFNVVVLSIISERAKGSNGGKSAWLAIIIFRVQSK